MRRLEKVQDIIEVYWGRDEKTSIGISRGGRNGEKYLELDKEKVFKEKELCEDICLVFEEHFLKFEKLLELLDQFEKENSKHVNCLLEQFNIN